MPKKGRVYHRYPAKLTNGSVSTECVVSFDGGKTFEGFHGKKPHRAKHVLKQVNGEWVLVEKELR